MNRRYDTYMLRDRTQDLYSIIRPYIGLNYGGWVFESVERRDPLVRVRCVYSVDGKIAGMLVWFLGFKNAILVGSDDISAGVVEHRAECEFGGLDSSPQKTSDRDAAAERQYKAIQESLERQQGFARHKSDSLCGLDWFWIACCFVLAILIWIGG